MCKVSGWGSARGTARLSSWGGARHSSVDTNKLQSLDKPILSMRDCHNSYPGLLNDETMFCAGYLEGGKGMVLFDRFMNTRDNVRFLKK